MPRTKMSLRRGKSLVDLVLRIIATIVTVMLQRMLEPSTGGVASLPAGPPPEETKHRNLRPFATIRDEIDGMLDHLSLQ